MPIHVKNSKRKGYNHMLLGVFLIKFKILISPRPLRLEKTTKFHWKPFKKKIPREQFIFGLVNHETTLK